MSVRLRSSSPPVHTLCMLASLLFRTGGQRPALQSYRRLLGHAPASSVAGQLTVWPEYGLLAANPKAYPVQRRDGPRQTGNGMQRFAVDGEAERAAGRERLQSELRTLQFPDDCRGRPLMLHSLGDRKSGWGMGSMLHEMVVALGLAHRLNRTMVLPDLDEWWYAAEDCRPRGFGCYFEPLSSCKLSDSSDIVGSKEFMTAPQQYQTAAMKYIGEGFRQFGLLWWRSQLMAFVWRPLPYVQRDIRRRRDALGWPEAEPVLAVHVRRGDKGGGGRSGRLVVDMEQYFDQIREMTTGYEVRSVFVAGDDAETVVSTVREIRRLGLKAMVDTEEARTGTDNSAMMLLTHHVNITQYAIDAIFNVEIMTEASLLLCTFGSHFSRLAHEIKLARGGYSAPPVTLDVLWFVNP